MSTDCDEVAGVAANFGAEIPFRRPEELADDHAPTAPVIIHALEWLSAADELPDYFCCIYPTAPFMQVADLEAGLTALIQNQAVTAFSVTRYPSPISKALRINTAGCLEMFWPEYLNTRSQDMPDAYHDAGQFYWGSSRLFLEERRLYTSRSVPVILPRNRVHDIDTTEDWETAEMFLKIMKAGFQSAAENPELDKNV